MMKRDALARELVKAALEFIGMQLWKRFGGQDCFGVRVCGEAMLGVVLGAGGQEYGVSLFRGPRAGRSLAELMSGNPGDDTMGQVGLLGFSMDPYGDLLTDGKKLMRLGGLAVQGNEKAPGFLAKPAGRGLRFPKDGELELLLRVLRGVMEAERRGLLKPAKLDDECGICMVVLGGTVEAQEVSVVRAPWPEEGAEKEDALEFVAKAGALVGLPRLKGTWQAGLLAMGAAIRGDEREVALLLVVSEEGLIMQAKPVMSDEFGASVEGMMEAFEGRTPGGRRGLPERVVFSSQKLCEAMRGVLEANGVGCEYQAELPELRAVAMEFLKGMGPGRGVARKGKSEVRRPMRADTAAPAAGDLAGWKAVDKDLGDRFLDFLDKDTLWTARAAKMYYGDEEIEHYFEEFEKQGVVEAYAAWGALYYRASKKGKTYAEKLLEKGLPEGEAILLKARLESYPSVYRIGGHDAKAGTVELEDVLLGKKVVVNDRLMSENIEDGVFFVARVFAAGDFRFIETAGPIVNPMMGAELTEELKEYDLELTPEGLRRDANKFGWLWEWMEWIAEQARTIRLANMDGDPLLWHTASFGLKDVEEVRRALKARADMQAGENEDEFLWVTEKGKAAKTMGGSVDLGRIELVGGELVLSVNSAKRLERARKWLEKIPGVVFENVTTRKINEAEEDRPADERMGKGEELEVTPEMVAAVQETMNQHYMAWLDMKLPVLKGRTPRAACKTAEGRREVAILIRTMPDPMGAGQVKVPREALMRALGLAGDAATERGRDEGRKGGPAGP